MRNKPPSEVAWESLHADYPLPPVQREEGDCGLCSKNTLIRPIVDVMSPNFTDWDKLPRDSANICAVCEWMYQTPLLRTSCLLVTADTATVLPREATAEFLLSPFSLQQALTLPLAGRKHLLPTAEWGTVTSDSGMFPWDSSTVTLAYAVKQLRESNASDAVLAGKDFLPSHSLISDPRLWKALDIVRHWERTPQLAILIRISRVWQPGKLLTAEVSATDYSERKEDTDV